jgi:hypothetical protein
LPPSAREGIEVGATVLATIGSLLAGGVVAAVTVVGLVNAQTSPGDQSPANVTQPVKIDYGSTN